MGHGDFHDVSQCKSYGYAHLQGSRKHALCKGSELEHYRELLDQLQKDFLNRKKCLVACLCKALHSSQFGTSCVGMALPTVRGGGVPVETSETLSPGNS